MTAERFLPNPFARKSGERLYRTGDIARYRADGAIEYLGRNDQQVKLRGFRIELAEIEAALLRHERVENAVVVLYGKNAEEKRLVAYLVLRNNAEDSGRQSNAVSASSVLSHETSSRPAAPTLIAELKDHLRTQLPAHMVPSAFVVLEQLQLSPNGKIDRKALPEVPTDWLQQRMPYEPPRTAAEIKIAQIWESVLCTEHLGVHDNFFELGAHSLLVTQAIARLRTELDVDVPFRIFFELPTIRELAAFIDKNGPMEGKASNAVVMRRGAELPLSFSQERVWFLERLNPGILAYNYQALIRFHGRFSVPAFEQALQEIIRRHEICRTTFSEDGGRPIQVIHAAHPVRMPVIDLQDEADPEARAQELIRLELQKPFDLQKLPLIYWVLFQLGRKIT